mmetsp:Transcript_65028/g.123282  ORF Transcript_65028/g.123282 Transcript_65028/m.123282 type:complete len:245 (+) Transcript_65028:28-762(+)
MPHTMGPVWFSKPASVCLSRERLRRETSWYCSLEIWLLSLACIWFGHQLLEQHVQPLSQVWREAMHHRKLCSSLCGALALPQDKLFRWPSGSNIYLYKDNWRLISRSLSARCRGSLWVSMSSQRSTFLICLRVLLLLHRWRILRPAGSLTLLRRHFQLRVRPRRTWRGTCIASSTRSSGLLPRLRRRRCRFWVGSRVLAWTTTPSSYCCAWNIAASALWLLLPPNSARGSTSASRRGRCLTSRW